ncbi:RNA polymerase sigma-70 factor, ECF subfamily [Sunxiuqinia elliptica]|uniref:RNA polymerase sigma factor n=2 Tax=Sunxiuqinia elliptica TaxID=655355 RepID=A0A1I2HZY1_9BACT|nr:RNA polymerase sigma-70 factor, ECF subfamily [Sunxiuqinia elliptica]
MNSVTRTHSRRQTGSMNRKDDHYYIEQVVNGNVAAFSYLVEKYRDMVYGLSLKMLKNTEDAEELAQDTFVKAFQSLSSYQGKSKFSTWLYRITYNGAITLMRKRKLALYSLDEQRLSDEDELTIGTRLAEIDQEELAESLKRAMEELPADDQVLITLFYYEDQRVEDIAHITGLSASNVKVKIHRARKKMYLYLKENLEEAVFNVL